MDLSFLQRCWRDAAWLTGFAGVASAFIISPSWAAWYAGASLWMLGSIMVSAGLLSEITAPTRNIRRIALLAAGKAGLLIGLIAVLAGLVAGMGVAIPFSAAAAALAGLNTIFVVWLFRSIGATWGRPRGAWASGTSSTPRN